MQHRNVKILLVDDDDVDVMAVYRGFKNAKIANEIVRARDGVEALEILRASEENATPAHPFVILLDLNMPRMDGFGFLEEIRKDPRYRTSVVFVLTTSSQDEDRMRAYDKNVAGYIVKSEAGDGFLKMVTMLEHYWRVVELP